MSGRAGTGAGTVLAPARGRPAWRAAVVPVAVIALLAAMALDTKVVKLGSPAATTGDAFSPAAFGKTEFPKVKAAIEAKAVDAATLAAEIAKDREAAGRKYGVATGGAPDIAVTFTGVAGKEDFGVYEVAVPGVPQSLVIRVQTGPAVLGTDLRDAPGTIKFGQFTNQIDYQNAGAALNREMKREVLAKIDAAKLAGKTIKVVGAFKLTDPANWLVTPVQLDVK